MARILWACWDGGGNLTPSLGIARVLEDRGHRVEFLGRPEMVSRVSAAGFVADGFAEATTDLGRFTFDVLPPAFGFMSSPAVGDELVGVAAARSTDLVVIDAMFGTALNVASRLGTPTAVMVHTLFDRLFGMWQFIVALQTDLREKAGFEPLGDIDTLWGGRDLVHVNTLGAFDGDSATAWTNVVHGAPVLTSERRAVHVELPWDPEDPTPTVLVSFSTVEFQGSPTMLQRALDALGELPVHVVATGGGTVEVAALVAPPNAHVVEFADHDALMDRASMVVGHGGHGTTMRALRHGLPIVGIPAMISDQVPITQLLEEWHVGRALPMDAEVAQIRAAAADVLADPSYRAEAAQRSRAFDGLDGAQLAANSVESLLSRGG